MGAFSAGLSAEERRSTPENATFKTYYTIQKNQKETSIVSVSSVRFWKSVRPLVARMRKAGFGLNRAVNEALLFWMDVQGDEELRLRAQLVLLRKQEAELRQTMRVMLRSGSYLPQYADKLFREKYDRSEPQFVRRGQVPLRALSKKEEDVARRVLAERERIAREIADVLDRLLPKKRFRLKPKRSGSRRRDKNKRKGGE